MPSNSDRVIVDGNRHYHRVDYFTKTMLYIEQLTNFTV